MYSVPYCLLRFGDVEFGIIVAGSGGVIGAGGVSGSNYS